MTSRAASEAPTTADDLSPFPATAPVLATVLALALVTAAGPRAALAGPAAAAIDLFEVDRPAVGATQLAEGEEITLDGRFDEPVWSRAEVGRGFVQQDPDEGQAASQQTEFQVAYSQTTLYIAVRALDDDPDLIIAKEMQRDGRLRSDDSIAVMLDTFLDRRNSYMFETNALGAKTDGLITDEGRDTNTQWDGVWRVAPRRTGDGWQVEMAIPFSTLRFAPGADAWGLQVLRRVQRRNESGYWAPVPRAANLFRASLYGTLTGLEGLGRSRQLDFKPYVTAGAGDSRDEGNRDEADVGLDVKWGLSRSMRLDLTVNTDFAEVEVDEQRVNLTRFSLFFPEKREFFLENAGIFEFGPRRQRFGRGAPLLKVFFSRRIGINDDEQVPIDGGVRLTGRAGNWNVGFLDVLTGSQGDVGSTNFTVARAKRNLGERSSLGAIVTRRDDRDDGENTVFGLDFDFNPTDLINVNGFYAKSEDDQAAGNEDWTLGAAASYRSREWQASLDLLQVGADFEPGVGFLLREDIQRIRPQLEYNPIWNRHGIRNLRFGVEGEYISKVDGTLETRSIEYTFFGFRTLRGDFFSLDVQDNTERLFEDFEIADGIVIPTGRYDADPVWGINLFSTESRPFAFRGGFSTGGFFDGNRDSFRSSLVWRPSKHLRSETSITLNDVTLPQGSFQSNVYRQRLRASLTPEHLVNALIQYNEASDEVGLNLRYNWIYRPGADLFVVFNQLWDRPDPLGALMRSDRQVIVKFTYLLQL